MQELQVTDASSVVVLGAAAELTAPLVLALRRHGVGVIEGYAPFAAESVIMVFETDRPGAPPTARPLYWPRLRTRAYENDACDHAVNTVLDTGARRLILVCDGRRLAFGERVRAAGLLRRLARRIDYECEVNGAGCIGTSHAIVDGDDDVIHIASAAASRAPAG